MESERYNGYKVWEHRRRCWLCLGRTQLLSLVASADVLAPMLGALALINLFGHYYLPACKFPRAHIIRETGFKVHSHVDVL